MGDIELLVDLHLDGSRQGPGGDDETRRAVDLFPQCLHRLEVDAALRGVDDHITTLAASIDDLPVAECSFDAIWSEGAIYIIGFERGVREWRRLGHRPLRRCRGIHQGI